MMANPNPGERSDWKSAELFYELRPLNLILVIIPRTVIVLRLKVNGKQIAALEFHRSEIDRACEIARHWSF